MIGKKLNLFIRLLTVTSLCSLPHSYVLAKSAPASCQSLYKNKHYAKALEVCPLLAEKNDKEGHYYLGMLYLQGLGTQPHQELAFKHLLRAAFNQHAEAQFQVAKLYSLGLGVERNESEAAKWYVAAAKNDIKEAILLSSLISRLGIGTPKNSKQAFFYYQQAIEKKAPGLVELKAASFDISPPLQAEAGQQEFERAMDLQLGLKSSTPQDQQEVIRLLSQAAELGHPEALIALAECYHEGKGVPQNDFDAFTHYKKAALFGHPEGIFQVSYHYSLGQGVPQDTIQAIKWFNQAKQLAKPVKKAPTTLSEKWAHQISPELIKAIAKTPTTSEEKYSKALELAEEDNNNNSSSSRNVNFKEALKWFSESAQSGNKNAQYKLGMFYLTGKGLPQNYVYSYSWLNLSSAQGMPEAKQAKIYLESKMTSEQLTEAQRLSEEVYNSIQ